MQTIAAPVENQPLELRMSCRPFALRKGNPLHPVFVNSRADLRNPLIVCGVQDTPLGDLTDFLIKHLSLHCPQSLVNKEFLTVCDAVNKGSYCSKQGCFQCMQPPLSITYYKNRCENLHQISRYYLISAKWDESWAKCFIHCTVHLQF